MSVLSHGVGTVCTLCYVYCCLVCSLMMNVDLKCADYISTFVAGSPESMVDIMKTLRVGFHSSCVLGCLSTGILGLLYDPLLSVGLSTGLCMLSNMLAIGGRSFGMAMLGNVLGGYGYGISFCMGSVCVYVYGGKNGGLYVGAYLCVLNCLMNVLNLVPVTSLSTVWYVFHVSSFFLLFLSFLLIAITRVCVYISRKDDEENRTSDEPLLREENESEMRMKLNDFVPSLQLLLCVSCGLCVAIVMSVFEQYGCLLFVIPNYLQIGNELKIYWRYLFTMSSCIGI